MVSFAENVGEPSPHIDYAWLYTLGADERKGNHGKEERKGGGGGGREEDDDDDDDDEDEEEAKQKKSKVELVMDLSENERSYRRSVKRKFHFDLSRVQSRKDPVEIVRERVERRARRVMDDGESLFKYLVIPVVVAENHMPIGARKHPNRVRVVDMNVFGSDVHRVYADSDEEVENNPVLILPRKYADRFRSYLEIEDSE